MKKQYLLLAALSLNVMLIKTIDASIRIVNQTGKTILLSIAGYNAHSNSINAVKIDSNKEKWFKKAGARSINGPIRFAFEKDMKKPKYKFYETNHKDLRTFMPYTSLTIQMTNLKDNQGNYIPGTILTNPHIHPMFRKKMMKRQTLVAKEAKTGEKVMW